MSTPPIFSPERNKSTRDTSFQRWTVDNSESRFPRLPHFEQSPKRSILKGSHTPLRYKSPLFSHEQEQRQERLAEKRVSFATDARLRLFRQEDTPDLSNRDVPNIIEEAEPSFLDSAFESPMFIREESSSPLAYKLLGSPLDIRKRRPDVFGKPPGDTRSPKKRMGGHPPSLLSRAVSESQDKDDLTQFIVLENGSQHRQYDKSNIFDEDEDTENEEGSGGLQYEQEMDEETISRAILEQNDDEDEDEDDNMHITQELSTISNSNRTIASPKIIENDHTMDMSITQEMSQHGDIMNENNRSIQSPMFDDNDDMIITQEHNNDSNDSNDSNGSPFSSPQHPILHNRHQQVNNSAENDRIVAADNRERRESSWIEEDTHMEITQEYSDDEDMRITQEQPPLPLRSNGNSGSFLSPARHVSNSGLNRPTTPSHSTGSAALRVPNTPVLNRIAKSPSRDSFFGHTGSPLNYTYSPSASRSFYLHGKSPAATNNGRSSLLGMSGSEESDHFVDLQSENADLMKEAFPQQLYESFVDDGFSNKNTDLAEFLMIVGVELPNVPNDLHIKERRRRSTYNIDYGSASSSEQAAAAASTLPQIEIYQEACKKLNELVQDNKTTINKIDHEISSASPQSFLEYLNETPAVRAGMEKHFSLVKDYAAIKSVQALNTWLLETVKHVLDTLQANKLNLERDKQAQDSFKNVLRKGLPSIVDYRNELREALAAEKEKEKVYYTIDHRLLTQLETEIEQQQRIVQDLKDEAGSLESQELELLEKANILEKRKEELTKMIEEAEKEIENNRFITERELADIKLLYKKSLKIAGCSLENVDESVVQMSIDRDINIQINRKKLENKSPDAVLVRMLEVRDRELGPLAELVQGLSVVAKDKWELNEIIQAISIYWNRVNMIKYEISNVENRFWVEIKSLERRTEPEDAGIACSICVSSQYRRTKFTVSFHVKPKDVLNYPAIDLSTFDLELFYGNITYEELSAKVSNALAKTGMTDLADTLHAILDQITTPL